MLLYDQLMAASKYEQAARVMDEVAVARAELTIAERTLAAHRKTNEKRLMNKAKATTRRARKAAANAVTPVESSGSGASEEEANVDA